MESHSKSLDFFWLPPQMPAGLHGSHREAAAKQHELDTKIYNDWKAASRPLEAKSRQLEQQSEMFGVLCLATFFVSLGLWLILCIPWMYARFIRRLIARAIVASRTELHAISREASLLEDNRSRPTDAAIDVVSPAKPTIGIPEPSGQS
jgi:hypothetical protein